MEAEHTQGRQSRLDGRRLMVLEARMGGATFRDIAHQMDLSVGVVFRDYQMALRHWVQPLAGEARDLELARLDRIHLTLWPHVLDGDYQAIDRILKVMAQRRALLALDVPTKIDITSMVERVAEEAGIDVEEALRDADEIIRRAGL